MDVRVPGSQMPFVGRVGELDVLAEAYAQASGGQTRIVCVEGPAGIGKTALPHGSFFPGYLREFFPGYLRER